MNFIVFDLVLLGLFLVFVAWFLYTRRHNLGKEGWLILYRTTWGMKLIDRVGKKYQWLLRVSSYFAVGLGYLLMLGMLYLVYNVIQLYVLHPTIVSQLKVPPITPLLPYFTELPGIKGLLPTFYFIHFIIAIVIVATVHEFAHGIFMRRYKIKIKSTGFAFLKYFPAFLGAFVEQDEKSMVKAKNFEQRAVLAAGTFANTITALLFFGLLALFFVSTFTPAGIAFDDYSYEVVDIAQIQSINGVMVSNLSIEEFSALVENATFNDISTQDATYIGIKGFADDNTVALYSDAPAIRAELKGAIVSLNGERIESIEILSSELDKYSPGEEVEITTKTKEETMTQSIVLGEHPTEEKAWLGVAFFAQENKNVMGTIFGAASAFNKPNIYYESLLGETGWFIYNLLWWVALINVAVALFNMLPAGGLDGGRFFYLTILSVGGSERFAQNAFKWVTYFFLLVLFVIMALWAVALIF